MKGEESAWPLAAELLRQQTLPGGGEMLCVQQLLVKGLFQPDTLLLTVQVGLVTLLPRCHATCHFSPQEDVSWHCGSCLGTHSCAHHWRWAPSSFQHHLEQILHAMLPPVCLLPHFAVLCLIERFWDTASQGIT